MPPVPVHSVKVLLLKHAVALAAPPKGMRIASGVLHELLVAKVGAE